jgi:C-terminal processing protease CtpA/Prc
VRDETPFWAYIPVDVTVSKEGILEGIGVTPDIEVQLDRDLLETTGRDSQLERALEYIRTGR